MENSVLREEDMMFQLSLRMSRNTQRKKLFQIRGIVGTKTQKAKFRMHKITNIICIIVPSVSPLLLVLIYIVV